MMIQHTSHTNDFPTVHVDPVSNASDTGSLSLTTITKTQMTINEEDDNTSDDNTKHD